jgi:outer membrane protein assembly factor BamB
MYTKNSDWRTLLKAGLVASVLAAVCAGLPNLTFGQTGPRLTPLFTGDLSALGPIEAAPLHANVQGVEHVLIASTNGTVVAVEPKTGEAVWRVSLPRPQGEGARLLATPARAGDYLVLAYVTSRAGVRMRHLVSVVNLRTGTVAGEFPTLQLDAQKPAMDGGVVAFNPPTALSRAALAAAGGGSGLGYVYVSFGNSQDIQPWHGWIFELDLEAWRSEGTTKAISAVLLTTPERDCGKAGIRGGTKMICGAGVWNPAGPQVVDTPNGYELLVATGNGELDLGRKDYAQSVLRLRQGLNFDPECDAAACANFDPLSPSEQCMASCRNLAIPRLLPDDPPLRLSTGRCDGRTFLECLALNDWDLGANGPIKIRLPSGQEVIVQPGKDGGLYMFDAQHMGRLYDREQIVGLCGRCGRSLQRQALVGDDLPKSTAGSRGGSTNDRDGTHLHAQPLAAGRRGGNGDRGYAGRAKIRAGLASAPR